ncbi:RNA polymerase sigma factor [Cryptosporangium aurantiacum]|uniref:RNA polymerase sigma-70 factor, ECF subfamily n=1 Tax=Cryptosporangium aurantiacum TaxID=134849 RepID=A0A1M7RBM0_9ACTN|nr:RNA polymerase sigma factor [Cryptosporangium aurantiacum]SHN43616.1 RNA polymerase sigma-70 factor, ECF subfamily [Cryptosporangium aurantiacum]
MTTTDPPDDRRLWAAAAGGDRDAFGVLFDRHARAVYNHCFRLAGNWAMAEDATAATFLSAWRHRSDLTLTRESALPWLLTVATNTVRTEHRSLRRQTALLHRAGPPAHVPDHADDIAGRIDDERRMGELLAATRTLPRAEREALALCVWSGVSYADAAVVLGISETGVRSRISRARARLSAMFTDPAHPEARTRS